MPTRSLPAQSVQLASRVRKRNNTRTAAVIWDRHVFINQPIECEISITHNVSRDRNAGFLFFRAARCKMEHNKWKHDAPTPNYQQLAYEPGLLIANYGSDSTQSQRISAFSFWSYTSNILGKDLKYSSKLCLSNKSTGRRFKVRSNYSYTSTDQLRPSIWWSFNSWERNLACGACAHCLLRNWSAVRLISVFGLFER